MIPIFKKLQKEKLLKENGLILDLGCGDGNLSLPFFQIGYNATLVDVDNSSLSKARDNFEKIRNDGLQIINLPIEQFKFTEQYDGIIISNVLSFIFNKSEVSRILNLTFNSLKDGGFLFFTLFGSKDQWSKERSESMSFYNKEESLKMIERIPYFLSEDFGQGNTIKGDIKTWHIFHFLYIK